MSQDLTAGQPYLGRIEVRGRFSLAESLNVEFGTRKAERGEQLMRMAFVADGYREQAAVLVSQSGPAAVEVRVWGSAEPSAVVGQVARILSLDLDGTGWDELGARDPLLARLQAARPGLRPPLFPSAYEALTWLILSARRPAASGRVLRDRLAAAHGAGAELAGRVLHAFPTPEQLLAVREFPGLSEEKWTRMHAVARLAADGELDTAGLRALSSADAMAKLHQVKGIGPYYCTLVVARALGHTDVQGEGEPRLLTVLGQLLGLPGRTSQQQLEEVTARWSPWRTWGTVAIRSAGPQLVAGGESAPSRGRPSKTAADSR
jgi:DNA-3-methyladenine glycosylase II